MPPPLIVESNAGLYCPLGDFHIDPAQSVARAVITHVHADHAHPGAGEYFCTKSSLELLKRRLSSSEESAGSTPPTPQISAFEYRESFHLGPVRVSFHPSGHVLGSAQVRLEANGEVWVVSGDYKREPDPTCAPFEPLECDVFVTEATFALPIFRWEPPSVVAHDIYEWWRRNGDLDRASVLICYSLGKAQRILAELSHFTHRNVFVHGAVENITAVYRDEGVRMLPTTPVAETVKGQSFKGELILAPPSARGQTWMRRFGHFDEAFASGWMRIRGTRRRLSYDRGFVLSDHADWPSLLETIEQTGAKKIYCTHGYAEPLRRFLSERGYDAGIFKTAYAGEGDIA